MKNTMQAMVFDGKSPFLYLCELPVPKPEVEQVLIRVHCCAVCRTDLHVVDQDLKEPVLPLIPGHEIIGEVVEAGDSVTGFATGQRVGVPWLGRTCGHCHYCEIDRENLCDDARFTGYHINGGFAEYCVADHRYCFPIPDEFSDEQAAPLMCAGLIGYRSYRMIDDAQTIGFYGFGAAAHILIQVARYEKRKVCAFTRSNDLAGQEFAKSLGAEWAGSSAQKPPTLMDAAIIFAPAGELVPAALNAVRKGAVVVCAGIHMSDIPSFPYEWLWGEREIRSVANLTREDAEQFLQLAPKVPVRTQVQMYNLEHTNRALDDLRSGNLQGAAVISMR